MIIAALVHVHLLFFKSKHLVRVITTKNSAYVTLNYAGKSSSSAAAKASALSGAYLAGVSSKGGSPAPSQSAAAKEKEQLMMRGDLLMAQAYQQAVQGKVGF